MIERVRINYLSGNYEGVVRKIVDEYYTLSSRGTKRSRTIQDSTLGVRSPRYARNDLFMPADHYLYPMQHPEENPWKINSQKEIYDNPWISVTEYQVTNPSGNPGIYGKVHFKNIAIGIVPLDEEMNTYLVGQYRFAPDEYSWEIPEGGGRPDIDPVISAQRELLEETGLKADHWQEVQRMHLSNSVSDELCIIYVARGLHQHEAEPEDTEQLTVKKLPFKDVYDMVCHGEILDSITVGAVLRVQLLISEGRL